MAASRENAGAGKPVAWVAVSTLAWLVVFGFFERAWGFAIDFLVVYKDPGPVTYWLLVWLVPSAVAFCLGFGFVSLLIRGLEAPPFVWVGVAVGAVLTLAPSLLGSVLGARSLADVVLRPAVWLDLLLPAAASVIGAYLYTRSSVATGAYNGD